VLPMGNYVIAGVGNYVIANPSNLGNYVIADNQGQSARDGLADVPSPVVLGTYRW